MSWGDNAGPDGISRCGAMRGYKCELKRYNEEMDAKMKSAQVSSTITDLQNGDSSGSGLIIYAAIGLVIILIIYLVWKK